jgi:hypothetical protein
MYVDSSEKQVDNIEMIKNAYRLVPTLPAPPDKIRRIAKLSMRMVPS